MNSTDANPKVVLFLGSGASAFAGYRTFETFPDLIFNNEIRAQEGLPPLHSTTPKILDEVRQTLRIAGKPTTHDNFLWALDDYRRLWYMLRVDGVLQPRFLKSTTLWGQFAHFAQITEDATSDITLTTIQHYSTDRVQAAEQRSDSLFDSMRRVYLLYAFLASKNDHEAPYLPVFTTNYDMLVEDLFSTFGHSSSYSLPLINGVLNCTTEGSPWSEAECQQNQSRPQGVHLYRVHGCVCWFYHGLGDERVYFHRRNCLQQPSSNLCAMYPGQEKSPGLNPHAFGFRELHRMLVNCQSVVFIGFSFRDDNVMHVMLSANAQRKTPLKIIVLDPSLRDTDVFANLDKARKTTPFPLKMPHINDIKSIDARFGLSDFDTLLIEAINEIL